MHRPRKRFGQHFLHDPGTIERIVSAVAPGADDVLVEIGPGEGAITEPLARLASHLHAVEFDRDLAAALTVRYAASERVTIHQADALRFDFASLGSDLRVVGNLPYNISTPLLFRLLDFRDAIRDMHFMLQKEVVDRMCASPGGRDYGRLTVMLGTRLEVARLFDVPPGAFRPSPRVTSAVVRLAPLPPGTFTVDDEVRLALLVREAFNRRRKTLRNALRGHVGEAAFGAAGIDPGQRPEQLPVAGWVALANAAARAESAG